MLGTLRAGSEPVAASLRPSWCCHFFLWQLFFFFFGIRIWVTQIMKEKLAVGAGVMWGVLSGNGKGCSCSWNCQPGLSQVTEWCLSELTARKRWQWLHGHNGLEKGSPEWGQPWTAGHSLSQRVPLVRMRIIPLCPRNKMREMTPTQQFHKQDG